jgi:hypothetical protein
LAETKKTSMFVYDWSSPEWRVSTKSMQSIGSSYVFTSIYNGTMLKLYQDAILQESTPRGLSYTGSNNNLYVWKADFSYSNFLDWTIDEVRIYNRALTDSEISAVYNATK